MTDTLDYRLLFLEGPHPAWVVRGADRRIVETNEVAVRVYGWGRAESVEMELESLLARPEDAPLMHRLLAGELGAGVVCEHAGRDGDRFPVMVAARCLNGTRDGLHLVCALPMPTSMTARLLAPLARHGHDAFAELLGGLNYVEMPAGERTVLAMAREMRARVDGPLDDLERCAADWGERLDPHDRPILEAALTQVRETPGPFQLRYRLQAQDGVRWLEEKGLVVETEMGLAVHGFVVDITDSVELERRYRLRDTIFQNTESGVSVTDPSGTVVDVNPAFCRITGYEPEELIGQNLRILKSGRHSASFYERLWESVLHHGRWSGEVWNRNKAGAVFPSTLSIEALRDDDGEIEFLVGYLTDISSRKAVEEHLQFVSTHDRLTGLPNRRLFLQELHASIARARRGGDSVALLYLGLNEFHLVNETFGHNVGDRVLSRVGERLAEAMRQADTVARLGGDEFVVLLEGVTNRNGVAVVAEKLAELITAPIDLESDELFLDVSVGIGLYPDDSADADALVQAAASAMSRAKELGMRWVFYASELEDTRRTRLRLSSQLHRALEREEFRLHFQPILDARSDRVTAVEALVRWNHPEDGMVPPGQFIPLAEETGLIVPIGEWVLRSACQQAVEWSKAGTAGLRVAVNLSASQVEQETFPDVVARILETTGMDPENLELEITESLLMSSLERTTSCLRQLKELGVTIAIDDFGTGYSSLSYLKEFPADVLKIDRTFVKDLGVDESGEAIAGAVIALAHGLGLRVVGEGVETEEQLELLRERGCDLLQGYFIARPGPPDSLAACRYPLGRVRGLSDPAPS